GFVQKISTRQLRVHGKKIYRNAELVSIIGLEFANPNVAPAAFLSNRPPFSSMDLQTDKAFASEDFKNTFLFVFRQWTSLSIEVATLETVDPRCDLRIFANAPDTPCIPIIDPPCLLPFFKRAGIFVHVLRPFRGPGINLTGKPSQASVTVEFFKNL